MKDAMRHFWKIANRAIIVFAGKIFFVKVLGKISGEIGYELPGLPGKVGTSNINVIFFLLFVKKKL